MYLKYYFQIILLLLICVTEISCGAYKEGYAITNNSCIVTNNNDTISGTSYQLEDFLNFPYGNAPTPLTIKNKIQKININLSDIKNIYFINKKKQDTATYIVDSNDLWQLLATKNNLKIYEKYYCEDAGYTVCTDPGNPGGICSEVYNTYEIVSIFSDKMQIVQLYSISLRGLPIDNVYRVKFVLQFVNTRYKLNLTHDELVKNYFVQGVGFDKQKKLFDFILEKEAGLE